MNNIKSILPGMSIILLITTGSFMLSKIHPSFEALVISMIFGMLIGNLMKNRAVLDNGVSFTLKTLLPAGIALYGTQLSFTGAEIKYWPCVIAVFSGMFALTYLISQTIGLSKNTGILLSTGLSVCGVSAIAVIAPLIKAKREETSISVISVMVLGLAGLIFYPLLADFLFFTKNEFAFLSGTTLPMLGQVKATAAQAGKDVLEVALKLKLIRISCLIFLLFIVLMLTQKNKKFQVPWFMAAFIALAIAVNAIKGIKFITETVEPVSRFLLSSSLTAIGLSVSFDSVTEEGTKPLTAIFLSWIIVVLLLYLIFSIANV